MQYRQPGSIHPCGKYRLPLDTMVKYTDCEKALPATVWAVKHFSNYLGGQKVTVETNHQPLTVLNSQRIRECVVTNARAASWLMALQSFDLEVKYNKN